MNSLIIKQIHAAQSTDELKKIAFFATRSITFIESHEIKLLQDAIYSFLENTQQQKQNRYCQRKGQTILNEKKLAEKLRTAETQKDMEDVAFFFICNYQSFSKNTLRRIPAIIDIYQSSQVIKNSTSDINIQQIITILDRSDTKEHLLKQSQFAIFEKTK